MATSQAQLDAARRHKQKCTAHLIRVNPESEPLAATRLAALKQAGQATAFFKAALIDYQMAERRE